MPVATATVSTPAHARAPVVPPAADDAQQRGSARGENPAPAARSPDAIFMALASLGIDYRFGGRSPATGFDCSGLVAYIYRDAYGMSMPTHTAAQSRMGKPINLAQIETGDLVFYNTLGQPNSHVGIYIGDNRFIHAPKTGAAVRIESMGSRYWTSRFTGARRIVF